MKIPRLIFAIAISLLSKTASSQFLPQPVAPGDATCTSIAQQPTDHGASTCTYEQGTLYSREGVSSLTGSTGGVANNLYKYKSLSVAPWTGSDFKLRHWFDEFGSSCDPSATTNSATGYITIKHVQAHCPSMTAWQVGGVDNYDWGGIAYGPAGVAGESNGRRFSAATLKAVEAYDGRTDINAGIRLEGTGYGGTTAILQTMLLKDPFWRNIVTIVNVGSPNTLFTRKGATPGNVPGNGLYWRGPASGGQHTVKADILTAWKTYDPDNVDLLGPQAASLAHNLRNVYFRAVGDPTTDPYAIFDITFFTTWCNTYKIACYGNWHKGGHADSEQFSTAPGFAPIAAGATACNKTPGPGCVPDPAFSGRHSDVRLDRVLPVFTNSTGNHLNAVRGHYNLGLEWNSSIYNADTADLIALPIRYVRRTGFGTGATWNGSAWVADTTNAIPDQPTDITVDITLRRVVNFDLAQGRVVGWKMPAHAGYPEQTGEVTVTKSGEVTVTGVHMRSTSSYSGFQIFPAAPAPGDWEIVYTRYPIRRDRVPGGLADSEVSNFQLSTDVGFINVNLNESDLVIDDLIGNTKVVFNCTGNSSLNCVAQEGKVSPDGTKIAYSVGFSAPGSAGRYIKFNVLETLQPLKCAQIYIYDIASDVSTPVPNHPGGNCESPYTSAEKAIDRQPAWIDNSTIVMVSNRANKWPNRSQNNQSKIHNANPVSQVYGYGHHAKALQLYKMNIITGTATLIGPHDLMSLAPEVMTNGDIYYSCYNAHATKALEPGSQLVIAEPNLMWLCRVDENGADQTVKIHGHKQNILKSRDWLTFGTATGNLMGGALLGSDEVRGVRNVSEIFKGKISFSNYYRFNHNGSNGSLYAFSAGFPHVEGCLKENCINYPQNVPADTTNGSGAFIPSTMKALTPWGQSADANPGFIAWPGTYCLGQNAIPCRSMGKAGYAAAWDANSYLITHSLGECFQETVTAQEVSRAWLGGNEVCRRRIMRVFATNGQNTVLPSTTNPFDTNQMVRLVDDVNYNILDGKRIATYQELYGQAAPTPKADLNQNAGCFLQVVDARKSEIYTRPLGWPQQVDSARCSRQGCAVKPNNEDANYVHNNMTFLSVRVPVLWDIDYEANVGLYTNTSNTTGFKDMLFYQRTRLKSDGSAKMRVPCETPLTIWGENAAGEVIAVDDMPHSLRRGETRTCHGCHDAHSEERYAALGNVPATTRFATTLAAADNPPLSVPRQLPKFNRVGPIITARCGGCHTGFEANANLYWRVVWDMGQDDFPWIDKVLDPEGNENLWRPMTSPLVSKFALESPLYWYASGRRTDGRKNSDRNWDLDFHAGHPVTGTTAVERGILRDWLDSGAPYQ